MITSSHLWAKLKREGDAIVSWHSLVDHSADVAAVVEALLKQPTIRRRLAGAAGLETLDPLTCARLAALAFLHDIGKANRGFRARVTAKCRRTDQGCAPSCRSELEYLFVRGLGAIQRMLILID